MNSTLKALSRVGARREAAKKLHLALRKFSDLTDRQVGGGHHWDISLAGLALVEAALVEVRKAKEEMLQESARMESSLQSIGGVR